MRILYITNDDDRLGGAKALMEIIIEMKKENIEPVVVTPKFNGINEFCNKNDIENYVTKHQCFMYVKSNNLIKGIIKYIPRWIRYKICNIIAIKKIEKNVDLNNIDYVHTNTSIIDVGALIAKKYKIKHIWHIREFGDKDFNLVSYRKNYIKFFNHNSYKMLAISNAVKNVWINKGIDPNKIQLLYDGIDISDIKLRNRKICNKKIKIIFSGAITPNKGQEHLIKALGYLDENILANIKVDFLGNITNRYFKYLSDIVKKLKLEKSVNFLGYCDNLRERLSDYDIGIICSKSEGFGRVTAEYMAAELCVIASNTGANLELIDDRHNGLIYNYEKDDDLANKIEEVYNNNELIEIFGKNARIKIVSNFTKEINAKKLKKIYLNGK